MSYQLMTNYYSNHYEELYSCKTSINLLTVSSLSKDQQQNNCVQDTPEDL